MIYKPTFERTLFLLIANHLNYVLFSARQDASTGTLKMSAPFYYKGNCNDQAVQDDLKHRHHHYLRMRGPVVSCRLFFITMHSCQCADLLWITAGEPSPVLLLIFHFALRFFYLSYGATNMIQV